MIDPKLYDLFRRLILANECDNDPSILTRFSDPDGVRSGKSGWSFGEVQWDTQNNPLALKCLRELGFTEAEINGVATQTIDVKPLEAKLRAGIEIIKHYDQMQLSSCLSRAINLLQKHNIVAASNVAILAIADYDNQYSLADRMAPGYLLWYLADLHRPVTAEDVLDFKLNETAYGKKRPRDCHRRYENLMQLTEGVIV